MSIKPFRNITSACLLAPPGRGGIGVLQLAGESAGEILAKIFSNCVNLQPGQTRFGYLKKNGKIIDEAVVACVSPDEFEINIHGGSAVARHALSALESSGADIVRRSKFSSLETSHPRFDNPAVGEEMLAAMETIVSPMVLRAVTSQWSGGLSALITGGLADIQRPALADELAAAAERFEVMRKLLNPTEVVLAGAPNAGKSTLANRLVGRDVAIVHETAGTTRDWLRERTLLDGVPVWLTDTAGLWNAAGLHAVDIEAVKRAWKQIRQADLVVLLTAGDKNADMPEQFDPQKVLHVRSKADVYDYTGDALTISTKNDEGIAQLRREILQRLGLDEIDADAPGAFTQRQVNLLKQAAEELKSNKFDDARRTLQKILNSTSNVYLC